MIQNRDPDLITSGNPIGFYEREFYPLSNFSSFEIIWGGETYPTAEHAYQSAKFMKKKESQEDLILQKLIRCARSAHDAFKIARSNQALVRDDWDNVKIAMMTSILRNKVHQHKYVKSKLLQTLDINLVEDSPKDSFWGIGPDGKGRNELGKIWMKLRSELIGESE